MEMLKKKWSNRRGASILLAMLFFLVCMMAGASILMAAASNAGKLKNNKEEQQKYLTLSSALNLVINELEGVTYQGNYSYTTTAVYVKVPKTDADGNPLYDEESGNPILEDSTEVDYYIHSYTQEKGSLTGTWVNDNDSVLPLFNNLEHIFAGSFREACINGWVPIDVYNFTVNDVTIEGTAYILELTADVDSDIYGGLADPVEITVELNEATGVITLTAKLKSDSAYAHMEAVLNPNDNWGKLFSLDYKTANGEGDTGSVKWSLDHIIKKTAS